MRLFVLWLCLLAAAPAVADSRASDAEVLALLERAQVAADRLDYSGIFVRQRGSEVTSTRITHRRIGARVEEKLESLDGKPRETVRQGDDLVTYLPSQRRKLVESRVQGPGFPAITTPAPQQIATYYRTHFFEGDRVAGRDSTAIALDSRDAYHFSYRFWFDRATGLLLRAQRLSETGDVVEQVAFVELVTGRQPAAKVRPSATGTRDWKVDNFAATPVEPAGWTVRWVPGGFRRAGAVTRTLVREQDSGGREVTQILFSDGLAGLSVFIEPWTAERSASPLQLGALNMVGKRHGKFWLTIVGEVPMAAIRRVADSVEFVQTFPR